MRALGPRDGKADADPKLRSRANESVEGRDWLRDGLRLAVLIVMAGGAAYFVVKSWHWALLCDSPIMHYVNFLMDHGMKPYSQITDNNFPGSYMAEKLAMRVFGSDDLAWRIYEFFLLGVLTAAMVVIARPWDWVAGVYAGGLFLLLHGLEGPWLSVEREQVLTVLLMVAYAAMFTSVRRRQPALMLVLGLTGAWAGAMKPTMAPLVLILVGMTWMALRRRSIRAGAYLGWAAVGIAVSSAVNLGFLVEHHAVADFLFTQRVVTPYYASLQRMPMGQLLKTLISRSTLVLMLAGLLLAGKRRGWIWEQWALAVGVGIGLASYIAQGKGFWHHRYLFVTYLFLLVGLELFSALQERGWTRYLAAATLVFTLIAVVPRDLRILSKVKGTSDLTMAMESDLQRLGGAAELQGKVQCLDLVYGCLNSLYHLGLVENTGFTGDMVIFDPNDGPAQRYHRAMWMQLAQQDPATVLVMTNEYFQGKNTFGKVDNWPTYARYLAANYTEVVERKFPYETSDVPVPDDDDDQPNGYRLYLRNGSALLREATDRLGATAASDSALR